MSTNTEEKFFASLTYRYFPYWPLFILLLVVSLGGAWAYLNTFATPTYEVSASVLIKDEKKGVVDSKITESIDVLTSNKIVENEINIIHSHALVQEVVNRLQLNTPVFEENGIKSISAYTTSPVSIKLKDAHSVEEQENIYFTYDKQKNNVKIDNKEYKLDEWVKTPYGEMLFQENKNKIAETTNNLFFSIIHPKRITNRLLKEITIEASSKLSTVIDLKLIDEVPQRGEDILNTLVEAYTEVAISEREKVASNTLEFVENRIELVEKELNDLESEVVHYKSTNGAVDLSEQSKLFLQNVGENDRRISEINMQLAVLDKVEKYVIAKNNNAGIVPSTLGINDPILSKLLSQLYDSEIKYQQLRKTTAENNPILASIKDEIESIRPSILENINNQRINLVASRKNLASTSNKFNSELQTIPQKERELLELSRQQLIKNDAYSFLLQKREETVLSYAPSAGDVRIVDKAEASIIPVNPKPLYIYLIAVVFALVTSFVGVIGKELFSSKLLFRSEIAAYSKAPIVAELSYVKQPKSTLFQEPSEPSVIEQFRHLRAAMGLYGRTFSKKKIMVTSSIPGEGKSFVSTNLAYSLSVSGKKVVLLDFDFRNPNVSAKFDHYKNEGIIDYLEKNLKHEKIIRSTAYKNLYVVPAGKVVGDYTELLMKEAFLEGLFEYLEKEFDFIIIDTPPLELVSDAYLLSEYSDISLLIMRHAYTPKNIVQRMAISHTLNSLKNIAIVFNGVKARGFVNSKYGFGFGYGYDNKYGDKTYKARSMAAKV